MPEQEFNFYNYNFMNEKRSKSIDQIGEQSADDFPKDGARGADAKPEKEITSEAVKNAEGQIDEEIPESVTNLEELMQWWLQESQTTNDYARKAELAYRCVKMKQALGLAKLQASEVKIERGKAPGTIGSYDERGDRKVAITIEGLELPPKHFADVLVHEGVHAGTITKKRIFDEGFAELLTKEIVPGALKGYYEKEQRLAGKVFDDKEMEKAFEVYDFDKPLPLVMYYLGVEWNDRLAEIKADLVKERAKPDFDEKKFLKNFLRDNKDVEDDFKKGAPDIYKKIKEIYGFDFDKAGLDVLRHLLVKEKV